jgi:hypothetical protein
MESIDIVLKNEKVRTYYIISWFIFIIHLGYFSFLFYNKQPGGKYGLIYIAIAITYRAVLYITQKKPFHPDDLFYVLMSWAWMDMNNYLMGVLLMVLWIFYMFATRKQIISFSKQDIKKRYFPMRKYSWDEVDNALVKDDILTIDFKNNKIIQAEVESPVNQEEFNAFASKQIASNI